LPEAAEGRDASPVEKMADTLKGSCGNMRALKMSTICAEPQDIEHSGELSHAIVLVQRLEGELGRFKPALETEI